MPASVPLPQQANYDDVVQKTGTLSAGASPFERSSLNPHGRTRGRGPNSDRR